MRFAGSERCRCCRATAQPFGRHQNHRAAFNLRASKDSRRSSSSPQEPPSPLIREDVCPIVRTKERRHRWPARVDWPSAPPMSQALMPRPICSQFRNRRLNKATHEPKTSPTKTTEDHSPTNTKKSQCCPRKPPSPTNNRRSQTTETQPARHASSAASDLSDNSQKLATHLTFAGATSRCASSNPRITQAQECVPKCTISRRSNASLSDSATTRDHTFPCAPTNDECPESGQGTRAGIRRTSNQHPWKGGIPQ